MSKTIKITYHGNSVTVAQPCATLTETGGFGPHLPTLIRKE